MIEFWGKEKCPECGAVNWFYLGHSEADGTGTDPEGVECFKCKHSWLFPLATEIDPDMIPEDAYLADGEENPA